MKRRQPSATLDPPASSNNFVLADAQLVQDQRVGNYFLVMSGPSSMAQFYSSEALTYIIHAEESSQASVEGR